MNRPRVANRTLAGASARMEYRRLAPEQTLPASILCAITFGSARRPAAGATGQALSVQVALPALVGTGLTELWHADGKVHSGRDGPVVYATGGSYLAGTVQIDEREAGGLAAAARIAYEAISRFTVHSAHPHLLRMYNYFSDINAGAGDAERYKLFCSGRAAGFHGLSDPAWPAATSIGRKDDTRMLQVYWLASNEPGTALENPRQVSAFHYPRQYGPSPPTFSRAMQISGGLLISGTASVLGHASHHPQDLAGQLEEILRNLASLRQASGGAAAHLGRGTLLKVYLRDPATAGVVAEYLREHLPAQVQFLILAADICRSELLVEIDAAHLSPSA